MEMFCALSLAISLTCSPTRVSKWVQAASAVCRASMAADSSMAAGWADIDTMAERRRAIEVRCILRAFRRMELLEVIREIR